MVATRLPVVCVRPAGQLDLEHAVRAGGGEVAELARANAIVRTDDDLDGLRRSLHPGIAWVQLGSAGIETWLDAGLIDASRQWTAAKGVHARPIAEYVVGMLVAAARNVPGRARTGSWDAPGGRLLFGSTVGIVGAGGIGRTLIELLEPFRVTTLALNPGGRAVPGATRMLDPTQLDLLLAESDYVVVAAPLTPATAGLLGERAFARMRPTAWLVNVARGSIVDTEALTAALAAGQIGGAVLDVTDPEPLPDDHPLRRLPNVVITPHVASTPELGLPFLAELVSENVRLFARGERLVGLVDACRGY